VQPLEELGLSMLDVDDMPPSSTTPRSRTPGLRECSRAQLQDTRRPRRAAGGHRRDAIPQFMAERACPASLPSQGHLGSALCYLPHAVRRLTSGNATRVAYDCKGSLFLGG